MQVSGKMRVFRRAHEGKDNTWYTYSTSVGSKRQDGTWANDYYEVSFVKDAKGAVIDDKAVINVLDGFLGCRTYMDAGGHEIVVSQIIVQKYEITEMAAGGFSALTDSDVPF